MKKFKYGFFKSYAIPLILIFLIPVSSYFYFDYAARLEDERVLSFIYENIQKSKTIPEYKQNELYGYFAENPPSAVCMDSAAKAPVQLIKYYKQVCPSYQYFKIARQLSYWAIVASIIAIVLAGLLLALSFRSQGMLYYCFMIAWQYAKLFSIAQVVIQGSLLVALSYIVPVQFTGHFVINISLLLAISIICAAYYMIRSLFLGFNHPRYLEGYLLTRDESGKIWSELDDICKKLNTESPDNLIIGMDDNFFVSENPVLLNDNLITGRTLYASIFHLEKFSSDESRAVMAHEMAHFSGNDTLFSKRIAPMLNRCDEYLNILSQSVATLPVYYFLLCFRSLFELSLCKISRQREERADRLAAELVGAEHLANAMVKLVLYSNYRLELENELYMSDNPLNDIKIFERVAAGFQEYLYHQENNLAFLEQEIEHPFDSHPPISKRIEALNIKPNDSLIEHAIREPELTWFSLINDAHKIKEELIHHYETDFKQSHEFELSYRLMPKTEEETALVEKYFPKIEIKSKNEKRVISINYDEINSSEWLMPVKFSDIKSCEFQDRKIRSKRIKLVLNDKKGPHKGRVMLVVSKMVMPGHAIVETFYQYYGRGIYAKNAAACNSDSEQLSEN